LLDEIRMPTRIWESENTVKHQSKDEEDEWNETGAP
jgi:hypothetical protein